MEHFAADGKKRNATKSILHLKRTYAAKCEVLKPSEYIYIVFLWIHTLYMRVFIGTQCIWLCIPSLQVL